MSSKISISSSVLVRASSACANSGNTRSYSADAYAARAALRAVLSAAAVTGTVTIETTSSQRAIVRERLQRSGHGHPPVLSRPWDPCVGQECPEQATESLRSTMDHDQLDRHDGVGVALPVVDDVGRRPRCVAELGDHGVSDPRRRLVTGLE